MKKLIVLSLLLVGAVSYSVGDSSLGPDSSLVNVTLPRPGAGQQNCLTDLTVSGSNFPAAGFLVSVKDGSVTEGTTIYAIAVTTGPFEQNWNYPEPLCTTHNSSMTIIGTHGASTVRVNYNGYIKGN